MHTIVESWPAEAEAVAPHDGPVFMQAELAPNRSLPNPAFTALMLAMQLWQCRMLERLECSWQQHR